MSTIEMGYTRHVGNTTFRFDPLVCKPHKFQTRYGLTVCVVDGSSALFDENGKLEEFTSAYCAKVPELMGKAGNPLRDDDGNPFDYRGK